ncbi:hypothetical protein [Lentzea sp. NPDC051838]|uniref:hypothetical protein n=1 Tax=Lentzea sp. NPDC051838 TaxID=3154849 RepID=UPI003419EAAE
MGSEPTVQRLAGAAPTAQLHIGEAPAAKQLAGLTSPFVQRATEGPALPVATKEAAPVQWISTSQTTPLPVAVPPAPVQVVARTPDPEPSSAAPVQRAVEVQRAETPQAQPQATTQPEAQGQNAEELLRKLYDPLLRRLKADLWLDRERRGALTDL